LTFRKIRNGTKNRDLSTQTAADQLWLNPEAPLDEGIIKAVNTARRYLAKQGYFLQGIKADGNSFFNAFLASYRTLRRQIPLIEEMLDPADELRRVVAKNLEDTGQTDLSKKIERSGICLATLYKIPLRIVTANPGSERVDDSFYPINKSEVRQWSEIPDDEKPLELETIIIVDLGGHFVYASREADVENSPEHSPANQSAKTQHLAESLICSEPQTDSNAVGQTIERHKRSYKNRNHAPTVYPKAACRPLDHESQFAKARQEMKNGHFNQAKDLVGQTLKILDEEIIAAKVNKQELKDQLDKSIAGFELLADIHCANKQYPEAAAILWYAKRLAKSDAFDQKIEGAEQAFFTIQLNSKTGYLGFAQARQDQQKLSAIRKEIQTKYNTIKSHPNKLNEMRALQLKMSFCSSSSMRSQLLAADKL
jgi:tetratricopeptide (TPR) repeat protein